MKDEKKPLVRAFIFKTWAGANVKENSKQKIIFFSPKEEEREKKRCIGWVGVVLQVNERFFFFFLFRFWSVFLTYSEKISLFHWTDKITNEWLWVGEGRADQSRIFFATGRLIRPISVFVNYEDICVM